MNRIKHFMLLLLLAVGTTSAFAQVTLTYTTSGSNVTVTGCTGSGEVVIPATVEIGGTTYNVTTIGANAFDGNTSITKLTFVEPSKVTTIDNFAFRDCTGLTNNLATEPVLPSSLTTLNRQAFRNCTGLTGKLTIPTSLKNVGNGSHGSTNGYFFAGCTGITEVDFNTATYIGHEAFDGCTALTTVTLPGILQTLGYNCFRGTGITSVVIPKSVTGFYQGAFMNCTSLESVEFEDGRTTNLNLQGQAFYGCISLTSVTLVEKVNFSTGTSTTSNTSNFSGCTALESIVIPSSNTVIPNNTFFGCTSLQTVTISANTTMIGDNAFSGCTELETVKYADGQTEANFPSTLTSIGSHAFSGCEEIDELNFDGCNPTIGAYAFENTGWYENQPDGLIYNNDNTAVIGYKGALTGVVTVVNGTTVINDNALENCTGITSIEFPASLTTIGKSAFLNTSITTVTIPESVTTIGISAFKNCASLATVNFNATTCANVATANPVFNGCTGLTTVNIGNTVTRIPAGVFTGTSSYHPAFTTITLPSSVTELGANAFQYCDQLTSIDLSNVTTMGAKAFQYCTSLESYTLPTAASFTTIPDYTFSGCTSLTTIVIPNNITAIGGYVFQNCTGATGQLVVPASVTSLGYSTFAGCTGLSSVKCDKATPATAKSSSFTGITDKILYVPAGAKEAYQAATGWSSFTNIVEEGDNIVFANVPGGNPTKAICVANWDTNNDGELSMGEAAAVTALGTAFKDNTNITSFNELQYFTGLTAVGKDAFRGCSNLESVTLPNVATISQYAFYCCNKLNNVTIPSSVTTIEKNAFYQCDAFTTITIPATVTSLGDYAFYGCDAVTTLSIGTGVTVLPDYVFAFMGNITSVSIPNNITEIKQHAFDNCSKLATITNASNVETIGLQAFANCKLLASASFANVETIGNNAFENCEVLALVDFPKVKKLGTQVFNKCDALTSISLPNTLNSVSGAIFTNCTGSVSITVAEGGTYKNDENNSCILTADGTTLVAGCNNTVIPSNITTIGAKAFNYVTGLTEATVPASVTSIGNYAFSGATGLTKVTMNSDTPCTLGNKVFTTGNLSPTVLPNLTAIYVPAAKLADYKTNGAAKADTWSTYEANIKGWMKVNVTGYGTGYEAEIASDHWCFIACPVLPEVDGYNPNATIDYFTIGAGIAPTAVENMISSDADQYDLYRLNEDGAYAAEWENYETTHDFPFVLENGKGYLYANKDNVELTFLGDFREPTSGTTYADVEVLLSHANNNDLNFRGTNLVGNPYPVPAYVDRPYYKLDTDGKYVVATSVGAANPIAPGEGIIVRVPDETYDILTFSTTAPNNSSVMPNTLGYVNVTLQQHFERSAAVVDNAIVSFNENDRLGKFTFNQDFAEIYIPQNGKDYAIVSATGEGEMPVNFKAYKSGNYSLTVTPNDVKMSYLHLIDNLTGADVDLLANPEYSFNANTDDYAARFRLVFSANNVNDDASTETETFAYFNGNEWVIANDGEATLQVVDMTGRVMRSISTDGACTVSTSNLVPGVYMLRLVNGDNNVKTQKIVVK
ncbi:MAG: leucine-rich repeat domain-containing protein [Bacteroidales bacterium]|nr:leucine-rich repeat domain-containing protein [Bacteroidales bacterium]